MGLFMLSLYTLSYLDTAISTLHPSIFLQIACVLVVSISARIHAAPTHQSSALPVSLIVYNLPPSMLDDHTLLKSIIDKQYVALW